MSDNIEALLTHRAQSDIEVTLEAIVTREGNNEVPAWVAECDGVRRVGGRTKSTALRALADEIEEARQ